ncbi:MAG: response regulator [Nannocystaceae bacterium]|nr:response regulator [Nannocystaceae bacterium]
MSGSLDPGRPLGDIALLFELSLAVGTSIDLKENCRRFLITLMARKSLDLSALWLRADAVDTENRVQLATRVRDAHTLPFHLLFGAPDAHVRGRVVGAGHPLLARLHGGRAFRLAPDAPEVAPIRGNLKGGVFAIFPLPPRGFVVLHSSVDGAFSDRELRQLNGVMAKLAVSVEGCIAHAQAIREIEERKKAEAERAAAREQLHQARRMEAIGRLAGGIAHDFNNLLTGMLGCTELLRPEVSTPGAHELLDVATHAARSAAKLTSQLLAYSRQSPLDERPVPLDPLVNEVAALLRRTIDPRIRLDVDLTLGEAVTVQGDASGLQSALLNLGLNARDAIAGHGTIRISTDAITLDTVAAAEHEADLRPGAHARIRVSDTGEGMPPETAARIFEPFFTTKEVGRGTGLGLSAVYGIVRSHHGGISVQTQVGRGTTFELLLPTAEAQPQSVTTRTVVPGTGRLLIVDDDATARRTLALMGEELGYDVVTAVGGEEALHLLDTSDSRAGQLAVDLVLLDVRMPGLSGLETLERLRRSFPDLPVVMASGFVEETQLHALRQLGIQGIVQKPVTLEALSHHLAASRSR